MDLVDVNPVNGALDCTLGLFLVVDGLGLVLDVLVNVSGCK